MDIKRECEILKDTQFSGTEKTKLESQTLEGNRFKAVTNIYAVLLIIYMHMLDNLCKTKKSPFTFSKSESSKREFIYEKTNKRN